MYIELELFINRNFLMPFQFKKKKVKKKILSDRFDCQKKQQPQSISYIYKLHMYDTAVIVKTYN